MGFKDSSWNISVSRLVILAASVFEIPNRPRALKTLPTRLSHAPLDKSWWVCRRDRQTDGRTSDRYVTLSDRCGQRYYKRICSAFRRLAKSYWTLYFKTKQTRDIYLWYLFDSFWIWLCFEIVGLLVTSFLIEAIGRRFTMSLELFVFAVFMLLLNFCVKRYICILHIAN